MAYRFSNGFDFFTSANQIFNVLNGGGTLSPSFARFASPGAASQGIQTGHGVVFYTPVSYLNPSIQTGTVGFAFQTNAGTLVQDSICFFFDSLSNDTQCYLGLNTSLQLQFYKGVVNSFPALTEATIGPASSVVLTPNTWYYIEITVTISNTVGFIECRLNGSTTPVISVTNVNNRISTNNSFNQVGFGQNSGSSTAPVHLYDDLYINDSTGPAPFNGYLGAIRIQTDVPNADSATAGLNQWSFTTPLGTDFGNLGNIPPNVAQYDFDGNVGDRMSFRFPAVTSLLFGLNTWYSAEIDAAGTRSLVPIFRNNGIDQVGASPGNLNASYTYYNQPSVIDPNTGQPWTSGPAGAANLCEIGLKVNS